MTGWLTPPSGSGGLEWLAWLARNAALLTLVAAVAWSLLLCAYARRRAGVVRGALLWVPLALWTTFSGTFGTLCALLEGLAPLRKYNRAVTDAKAGWLGDVAATGERSNQQWFDEIDQELGIHTFRPRTRYALLVMLCEHKWPAAAMRRSQALVARGETVPAAKWISRLRIFAFLAAIAPVLWMSYAALAQTHSLDLTWATVGVYEVALLVAYIGLRSFLVFHSYVALTGASK
ncbi:MAG: hypothetical protein ACOZIN_12840 [Myxococcota bacterium]